MQVCFSVGKNSKAIVDSISKHYDDIKFYVFDSVSDMINESLLRHIFFDRIVFSESMFDKISPERDLRKLNDYIIENSESTSVVLIGKDKDSEVLRLFNEIFKSPLYTAVILQKTTLYTMCEIVKAEILELRMKYYPESQEGISQPDSKKSKSSESRGIGSLFSRSKKENQEESTKTENSVPSNVTDSKSAVNESNPTINNNTEVGGKNIPQGIENGDSGMSGSLKNRNLADSDWSGAGVGSESPAESSISSEDDFLGLGSFGRSHSDTGFLDEEELESQEGNDGSGASPVNIKDQNYENSQKSRVPEKQNRESYVNPRTDNDYIIDSLNLDIGSFSQVVLITGERGVGVTSTLVDFAFSLYNDGESVLIVDCDFKRNGVLSYIDSRDFYDRGNENGIDNINPYMDEQADILSNGYGSSISKSSLMAALNALKGDYDRILLDCPLDCLGCISERVMRGKSVLILVKADRASLISTSIGLTDRVCVESGLEKYMMNNSIVGVFNPNSELYDDIDFIKETFMFPNGCWLENIE